MRVKAQISVHIYVLLIIVLLIIVILLLIYLTTPHVQPEQV